MTEIVGAGNRIVQCACVLRLTNLLTYFHEAVVVEEAEHGGACGRVIAEPRGGDVGDDLVDRGARLGVEVQRQPVPLRRPPAASCSSSGSGRRQWQWQGRLPSAASAHAIAAEGHDEEQDKADPSGGIHCRGGRRRGLA